MNKFHAKRTELDGIAFDSKREAARYSDLKLLERAGEIKDLKCQVKFAIHVQGEHICNYFADFEYRERMKERNGNGQVIWRRVVEDVKSPPTRTPVYRIKRDLIKAIYGIEIRET